jgi:hypothetical protein
MRLRSAIVLAALGSGVPSTVRNAACGEPLLASTRAAGTMAVGDAAPALTKLAAGVAAHAAISTLWGTVLWYGLPRRHTIGWGALAGVGIAALDLGVIGARIPAIAELAVGPQVADHLAFGAIVGWAAGRRDRRPDQHRYTRRPVKASSA